MDNHGSTSTTRNVDYTVYVAPLREWHPLLPEYIQWCWKRNKNGQANQRKLRLSLKSAEQNLALYDLSTTDLRGMV
ncbi:uncharacterized protein L201_005287 [Kwoniella dendrophila CBS 6074]|uniref:Uncharacterized protein n=1 Tax=Kwoniella dendrophila CBS 6074 TaxID=1295534 RepID=A0AAX4JZS0_9TREE